MKHVSIIEIFVVATILVVLLLAVFPSFKRAQIMSGVTKTRISLANLTQAVMKYNLDYEQIELSQTSFWKNKSDLQVKSWVIKYNAAGIPISSATQQEKLSFSQFGLYPADIQNVKTKIINDIDNRKNLRSLYYVFGESHCWKDFTINGPTVTVHRYHPIKQRLSYLIGSTSPFSPYSYYLDEYPLSLPYRGVVAGPLIDRQIELLKRKSPVNLSQNMTNNIILYNPSNGTLSHGYLLYELAKEDQ